MVGADSGAIDSVGAPVVVVDSGTTTDVVVGGLYIGTWITSVVVGA